MKPIIIVVLLLLGWMTIWTIFAAQKVREKEIEEEAYARGYKAGKHDGFVDGVNVKATLNMLIKTAELPPIDEVTDTTEGQCND